MQELVKWGEEAGLKELRIRRFVPQAARRRAELRPVDDPDLIEASVRIGRITAEQRDFLLNEKEFILACRTARIDPEKVRRLDGGGFLWNFRGKYAPQLTVLLSKVEDPWEEVSWDLQVPRDYTNVKMMRGEYFVSRKGTKCFRVKPDGPHALIAFS